MASIFDGVPDAVEPARKADPFAGIPDAPADPFAGVPDAPADQFAGVPDAPKEKPSLFSRAVSAVKRAVATPESVPPAKPIAPRFDIAGAKAGLLKVAPKYAPQPTEAEAVAAVDRLRLGDEGYAKMLRPDAPDKVTGAEILEVKEKDYDIAGKYMSTRKLIEGLKKPSLTPSPLPEAPGMDATATTPRMPVAEKPIPRLATTPTPLAVQAPAEATAAAVEAPEPDAAALPDAKLVERAQTLAEALPSAAKGFIEGATGEFVKATDGTEGVPGALGKFAGILAGAVGSGVIAGPAGSSLFLANQHLNELKARGMDPSQMSDPLILATALAFGIGNAVAPVSLVGAPLKRALTGGALGAGFNLAEEEAIAVISETPAERLPAVILGGAMGSSFGALLGKSKAVRDAVSAKLPEAEMKALDDVVAEVAPRAETEAGVAPRAEEPVAPAAAASPRPRDPTSSVEAPAAPDPDAAPIPAPPRAAPATPEQPAPARAAEAPIAAAEAVAAPEAPEVAVKPTEQVAEVPELAATEPPTSTRAPGITPEAAKVLTDLDAAGMAAPEKMTLKLRQIARENGITTTKETTPAEVIEGLRERASSRETFDYSNWRNEVALEPDPSTRGRIIRSIVRGENSTEQDMSDVLDLLKLREGEEGPNGFIVNAGDIASDIAESPRASDELKVRAKAVYDEVFKPESEPAAPAAPRPRSDIKEATPTKPFGSSPDGVVRAPEPDEAATSARKAYTSKDREQLGLNELDSPDRRGWQAALDEARSTGKDGEAEILAKTILETPRAMNDVETAAAVVRMSDLKTQHEAALDRLKAITDPAEINAQARTLDEIEQRFDMLSTAVRYSGTEKGRNLAAQKITINKSYELLPVLARAKAKKGKDLTPKEKAKFKEMTETLKKRDAEIADLNKRLRDTEARDAINTRRRAPRRPQEVKASIADLTEKTRRLLRAGCLTS